MWFLKQESNASGRILRGFRNYTVVITYSEVLRLKCILSSDPTLASALHMGLKELKHAQLWEQKIHQSEVAAGVAQWEILWEIP